MCHLGRQETLGSSPLAHFAEKRTGNIQDTDNAGNDRVGNGASLGGIGELETQSSVHNTENHEDSAIPDVSMADESSSLILEEVLVV
jgi:hypothetical protein